LSSRSGLESIRTEKPQSAMFNVETGMTLTVRA
jgi:hypothetical protein